MFRTVTMTGFAVLALSAASAFADPQPAAAPQQPSTGPVATAPQPDAKDSDPIICKKEEATGTRLGAHKTCKPKSAWDEESKAARELMDTRGRLGTSPKD